MTKLSKDVQRQIHRLRPLLSSRPCAASASRFLGNRSGRTQTDRQLIRLRVLMAPPLFTRLISDIN